MRLFRISSKTKSPELWESPGFVGTTNDVRALAGLEAPEGEANPRGHPRIAILEGLAALHVGLRPLVALKEGADHADARRACQDRRSLSEAPAPNWRPSSIEACSIARSTALMVAAW
jgi:hypothetical protein